MKSKIIKYSLVTVIIVISVLIYFAFSEYNRKHVDVTEETAAFTITSEDLITAFNADEKAANTKYLDKIISISGKIKSIDKDETGIYTIALGMLNTMSSVRCSLDSIHNQVASSAKIGENISIKGTCTGYNADELLGSDVILNRCAVIK